MSKSQSPAIIRWLRENGMPFGALTHHDTTALLAADQIAALWIHGATDREAIALAFRNVVLEMQPHTRFLAFHAIAHAGDWHNRGQLWNEAHLPQGDIVGKPECKFGPRKEVSQAA